MHREDLMRHSGMRLTTNIYQHLELVNTAGAVNQLPVINSDMATRQTRAGAASA